MFRDDGFENAGCSIQESSAYRLSTPNEKYIWLGRHDNRMELSQSAMSELLPILEHFVKTGYLPQREGAKNDKTRGCIK